MHVDPAAPPHSSFVSPLLFGRSTQLETLRSALERTRGGLGGTVLVTGDAGVGKSRLIATARAEALENGFQVLGRVASSQMRVFHTRLCSSCWRRRQSIWPRPRLNLRASWQTQTASPSRSGTACSSR